jgi:hypothetical protein
MRSQGKLSDFARREGATIRELCTAIEAEKLRRLSLTVATRSAVVHVDAATETRVTAKLPAGSDQRRL